jgi:pheromone shutdown-related protein TraB
MGDAEKGIEPTASEMTRRIALGDREIILVGTAHISQESVEEVRNAIRTEGPARVCVEIDGGRYKTMSEKSSWESLDIVKVIKEGKAFLFLANLILSSFQRRMGESIGASPGEEMKAAVEVADELGIPYHFCDREVGTTLRRAWGLSGLWNKMKLLSALISSAFSNEKLSEAEIEALKKKGAVEDMMGELAEYLPKVKEVLIDERDRYLAAKIYSSGTGKIVAIVGAGHMNGIETWLGKMHSGQEGTDVTEIENVPKASPWSKIVGWLIPAVIVGLLVFGFFISGKDITLSRLLTWVLLNGTLAAVGSMIAFGHPLTWLVSFFGAPIATLNPFLAVGMFSGLCEASLRKPRVEDFETLATDIVSIRGFWKNRVTRILLVFLLSSFGGMIGNAISFPFLTSLLFKH